MSCSILFTVGGLRVGVGTAGFSGEFTLCEDGVELGLCHFEFVGVLGDPLGESIVLGRYPTTFELGTILALAIELKVEGVLEVGKLRGGDGLLGEDGGNEDDTVSLGENEISGKDDGSADADGCINGGKGHLSPG